MFETLEAEFAAAPKPTRVAAWHRLEAGACARRLADMAAMLEDAYTADGSADRDHWCIDNWDAVCAHIGAVQRITSAAASAQLLVALAVRDRFPTIGALFLDGLIDYQQVRLLVTRAVLLTEPAALRELDDRLATALQTSTMSQYRLQQRVDALIAGLDPDAVRRTTSRAKDRQVSITYDEQSGTAELFARMFIHDGQATEDRLDALADTVCPHDPRTREQCRADAIGALAAGTDRLTCLCPEQDCPAAQNPPPSPVVIHLVAHLDPTTAGPSAPGPTPEAPPPEPEPEPEPGGETDDGPHDDGADWDSGSEATHGAGPECAAREPESDTSAAPEYPFRDLAHHREQVEHYRAAAGLPASPSPSAAEQEADLLHGHPARIGTPGLRQSLAQTLTATGLGFLSSLTPAVLIGRGVIPGVIACHAARSPGATISLIHHPGHTPPEPRYRPSRTLAEFVRARDLTCRYPGCHVPATHCDLDHTIPWPHGPTCASNLKCLCRRHHLLKTFWFALTGWSDRQLPDGTVVWTDPDGHPHTTTAGSHTLFPSLCTPTAPVVLTHNPPPDATDKTLRMPRRRRTRRADRAHRIHHERAHNHAARAAERNGAAAGRREPLGSAAE